MSAESISTATAADVPSSPSTSPELVIIDYDQLLQPFDATMDALIEKAYGFDGLGVLAIRGVPQYPDLRANLLPLGYTFGNLPEDIKQKYVHEESTYSFGWSHGKERLEGKPDVAKGSYYANPLYNEPTTDKALIEKYPASLHPNIWPTEDLPPLEDAFMALGRRICDVGAVLTKHCDAYVQQRNPQFPQHHLSTILSQSKCPKARLLYYFAFKDGEQTEETLSSWCGAHLDSGSLTGLTSALFFDEDGNQIPCPDPAAGLYIKSRNGESVQVKIPADCIAYQIGECMQIHSGGLLLATPHSVRAASTPGVSRATFACFMQPNIDHPMALPPGGELDNVLKGAKGEFLPPGVPPLLARWETDGSQNYGDFSTKTFSMYY